MPSYPAFPQQSYPYPQPEPKKPLIDTRSAIIIALVLVALTFVIAWKYNPSPAQIIPNITIINQPQPVFVNVTTTPLISVGYNTTNVQQTGFNNNIQASHVPINFSIYNSTLTLQGVDRYFTSTGSSMQPTVFTGNIGLARLFNVATDKDKLKEGDIIVWKLNDDTLVSHRITALYDDFLLTQGDHNELPEKIYYDNITYVIVGVLFS